MTGSAEPYENVLTPHPRFCFLAWLLFLDCLIVNVEALLLLRVPTAAILTHSLVPEDYNLQQHHCKNLRFSHCAEVLIKCLTIDVLNVLSHDLFRLSGVLRGGGFWGFQTPLPQNSECPPKSCQAQPCL